MQGIKIFVFVELQQGASGQTLSHNAILIN